MGEGSEGGGGGRGRWGSRGGWLARTPPVFVHSALGAGLWLPPSRFIVLQVAGPAAQTRGAAPAAPAERPACDRPSG